MSIVSPWKHDFAIFSANAHPNLCYLDSAATCLTPKNVADAMYYYQCFSHANSHKGLYQISAKATEIVEQARDKVATFMHAPSAKNIVFSSGTTESINLVAHSFVQPKLVQLKPNKKSNIVVGASEHHANLLPWQRLAQQHNAELRIAPLDENGIIDMPALARLLDEHTVIVAICHISNVVGQLNPVNEICHLAHEKDIPVLVDGAQAIVKGDVNVVEMGCDFYVFSAHKLYGPTGCGVLYARENHLADMSPYNVGGGIVNKVTFQETSFIDGPLKLEPGSHHVAGLVGLVEAIDYLNDIGWHCISQHINKLSQYLTRRLDELPFIKRLFETADGVQPSSVVCVQMLNVHPHDVASILDSENIAVRAGHHCAQPLHQTKGINASVRFSLGIYNESEDIDRLIDALVMAHQLMVVPDND